MIRDLSKMYPQTRHPYYEMSYGLNIEMHKQVKEFWDNPSLRIFERKTHLFDHSIKFLHLPSTDLAEIVKRLNAICAQVIPFLSQEHQQQVVQAVERAKQVTMAELNAIIGQQQLQAQHLSHGHGLPVPLTPHPSGLQPPAIPPIGSSAGLLALSSALGGQSHLPIKDEKKHHDNDHQRGMKYCTCFAFGYDEAVVLNRVDLNYSALQELCF
ncbi:hypothetical protein DUI87_03821 [Hirundo rustica rustica]|uniref:Groucho/TLE N-terminal Q-rich domain-containing protein n=1 Tax=Hirundo rustica rustica TaxID=333673 RepID=A0A3M0L2A3_HIRRU|nr:hypothetical protein DUI87_03821 [Hirundo rustica rustica]